MTLRTGLIITGDSSGAQQAVTDLDTAMDRAEKGGKDLSVAVDQLDAATDRLVVDASEAAAAIDLQAAATGRATAEQRDLAQGIVNSSSAIERAATEAQQAASGLNNYAGSTAKAAAEQRLLALGVDTTGKQWERASVAVQQGTAALRQADDAAEDYARTITTLDGKLRNVGTAMKFTAREGLGFSRQFADIGVTAAMGMNPLMIAIQQGPQLLDIFQEKAIATGTTIGVVMRAAGVAIWTALAPFLPVIAAVAAGAALIAAAVGLVTEEINKTSTVTVTWQDVMLGAFDVVSDAISSQVTAAFEAMGIDIGEVWEGVKRYTKSAINFMIGASIAVPKLIADTYDKIPAAIGDAFYSGANLAIKALNWLVEKSAGAVNGLVDTFNAVFGTKIKRVMVEGLGAVANPYAGAMAALGSAGAKSLAGSFSTDYVGNIASALSGAAQNRARLRAAAEKGGKDAGTAGGKAGGKAMADEWAKAFEENWQEFIKNLTGQLGDLDKWMADWAKKADTDWQAMQDGWKEDEASAQRIRDAEALWAEEDRRKALDTAYAVADILGGAWGDLVGTLADAIIPLIDVSSKLGKTLEAFSKGAAIGGAVGGVTGSSSGGAIGGGLAGAAFEEFASKGLKDALGAFGGPLAGIAGGIIGGIIGGLVTSTPRASATVSIIAGEAMETAVKGSSGKLKEVASGMANSVISGLTDIAAELGARLTGDASVSVGVRKGKYRVDTTGAGITKTSKGAVDFGEDQAAAIAYALQDAIKDGVLGGLSASLEKLITGDGDLEAQLQKALSFKGVFDDLAKNDDPAKWAQDEITKWHDAMADIFAEAGATAEELAELERLTGIKRTEAAKDAAEQLERIAQEALDRERQIRDKQIELLTAQGKAEEAEAMARQGRIDDAPEYLRVVQQAIEAANLLAEAESRLAERRALAKQNAQEMFSLEERLQAALGNDDAVTRLQRENELRLASSAVTREYLLQIYAAEDLATAQAEQAAAAKAAADAIAQAADELAAAQKAIADERYGIETQLLQLLGNTDELRRRQLERTDPANRDLLQEYFDTEDAIAAQEEAAKRAAEAQQAAAAAAQQHAQAVEQLRSRLAATWQRDRSELVAMRDQFSGLADNLAQLRAGLAGDLRGDGNGYDAARDAFLGAARKARLGDAEAMQGLGGDANAFLAASEANASSRLDYQRDVAAVARAYSEAEATARRTVDKADRQIDALDASVQNLIDINEKTETVSQLIEELNRLQEAVVVPSVTGSLDTGFAQVTEQLVTSTSEAKASSAEQKSSIDKLVAQNAELLRMVKVSWQGGYFKVATPDDKVVKVSFATTQPVKVMNTDAEAVPVEEQAA